MIDGSELVADFSQAAGDLDLPRWPCELNPSCCLRRTIHLVCAQAMALPTPRAGARVVLDALSILLRRLPTGRATQFGFVGPAIGRTNRLATGLGRVFWEGTGNRQPEPTGRYRSSGRALALVRTTNGEMRGR